jgi:hypothetical protein
MFELSYKMNRKKGCAMSLKLLLLFCLLLVTFSGTAQAGNHDLQKVCDDRGIMPTVTNDCEECENEEGDVNLAAGNILTWFEGSPESLICGSTERAKAKTRLVELAKEISDIEQEIAELEEAAKGLKEDGYYFGTVEYSEEEDLTPQNDEEEEGYLNERGNNVYELLSGMITDGAAGLAAIPAILLEWGENQAQSVNDWVSDKTSEDPYGDISGPYNNRRSIQALRDFNAISIPAKFVKNRELQIQLNFLKDRLLEEQQDLHQRMLTDSDVSDFKKLLDEHDKKRAKLADCQKEKCPPEEGHEDSSGIPEDVVGMPEINLPEPTRPQMPGITGMGALGDLGQLSPEALEELTKLARDNAKNKTAPPRAPSCQEMGERPCKAFGKKEEKECLKIVKPYIKACKAGGGFELKTMRKASCAGVANFCQEALVTYRKIIAFISKTRDQAEGDLNNKIDKKISVLKTKIEAADAEIKAIKEQREHYYYNSNSGETITHAGEYFEPKPPLSYVGDGALKLGKKSKAKLAKLNKNIDRLKQEITKLGSKRTQWSELNLSNWNVTKNSYCLDTDPGKMAVACMTTCEQFGDPVDARSTLRCHLPRTSSVKEFIYLPGTAP